MLSQGFYLFSLGCPKNTVESEIIAGSLLARGYVLTDDLAEAELSIVNTCAFLSSAREETASVLMELRDWKQKHAGRKIVVAGCLMGHPDLEKFQQAFPQVDLWVPIADTADIPSLLAGTRTPGEPEKNCRYLCNENMPRCLLTAEHVAYLKICDGCDNHCAYCAIPALRGALRSRSLESVMKEARNLVSMGVRELVIIAQDITAYGDDLPPGHPDLADLLAALEAIPGDFVMRLLYTHPAHYTDKLIAFLSASKKVLPYLDIPLQHISDRILRQMNRHIDSAGIRNLLRKLRNSIPGLTLRTTFITGLPGETEEEFAQLCDFAREMKFERMGVFAFEPEEHTAAAAMPDQVDPETADARAEILLRRQKARMGQAQRRLVGTVVKVMADGYDRREKTGWGRTAADAPEIDNEVYFRSVRSIRPGQWIPVQITAVRKYNLIGKAI